MIVEGLGALAVTVNVALFGPFASESAIQLHRQAVLARNVLGPR